MQFKHPEILYFLFALLIPLFIHLFQLQRFVKVPFTNVAFLKKLELQTRKSSRLKKFLVLTLRLLAFASLILAFAQPYFSKSDTGKDWETVFIIDNSASMDAEYQGVTLFQKLKQEILENLPEKGNFSFYTFHEKANNLDKNQFKERLKSLETIGFSATFSQLFLEAENYTRKYPDKNFNWVWITDLQGQEWEQHYQLPNIPLHLIQLTPEESFNISIDTCAVKSIDNGGKTLEVTFYNDGEVTENVPFSVLQNDMILAKTMVSVPAKEKFKTALEIGESKEEITLKIEQNDRYAYDNEYFVSLPKTERIPILEISKKQTFVKKILHTDEFVYKQVKMQNIPYSHLSDYRCIVLNEPSKISQQQSGALYNFVAEGGTLLFIPYEKPDLSQAFWEQFGFPVSEKYKDTLLITKIHFEHPVFQGVFERKVSNFQYPFTAESFALQGVGMLPVMSFENGNPFLTQKTIGKGNFYMFASPLNPSNTNFKNTPLVVPIFYKIAQNSAKLPVPAYRLGKNYEVEIMDKVEKDRVLSLSHEGEVHIPIQQIFTDHATLYLDKAITQPGFYEVENDGQYIQSLALNTAKEESSTISIDSSVLLQKYPKLKTEQSLKSLLSEISEIQHVTSYFRWFLLAGLLFLIAEMIILKYM